ncbi:DUF58 domain-containing protein [Antarcticibacterium arcticum]|uniref:DUF58 domain-containing protein n=1 Tax=Antarcticibacterium arcticum TaxID=2585771 RepID=A0A5B8YJL8_9FLAO|nr:DUF58 domain-containing protein [Antarcticibacterium arcticum]QED37308.1 DUF58 domain-containing protein [Antarcticibacterium arcticum]
MTGIRAVYFHQRVFVAVFSLAMIFLFSYWFPVLYIPAWLLAVFLLILIGVDLITLFSKKGITAKRNVPDKLSNSDQNPITIDIRNNFNFKIGVEIIDELPVQFQKRDFLQKMTALPGQKKQFEYSLRPVERGEYYFGKLNIFISSPLRLVKKRLVFDQDQSVKVYPSFIQMRQYDFMAIDNRLKQPGLKRIRRLGHTQEFEQIKEYVAGDDVRSINWKATAKQSGLMVNQYQEEKAQPIYLIIDKGRVMKMPFEGLSLLDYSINTTLAFANVALQKKDKVGFVSFSNEMGNLLPAIAKKTHLNAMLESLYNIKTDFLDSDFGLLYTWVKRRINHRSLLLLFTNFEHMNALDRNLGYLKAIARQHVLVVIFFENSELEKVIRRPAETISQMAHQTIARDISYEKRLMAKKLQQNGIQTILSKPGDLSVNTINKYLEIKARGLL